MTHIKRALGLKPYAPGAYYSGIGRDLAARICEAAHIDPQEVAL